MPTIAEILLEQGRQMADARRQSGQDIAQTIGTVGNTIASLPMVYQQAQRQQQQNQVNDLQLQGLKRNQSSQDALEAALKNPSNYKPDGSVDDQAIGQELKGKNIGAWQQWSDISAKNIKNQLETREMIEKIATSQQARTDKDRQIAQAQQNYLGGLAYHAAQSMDENPNDPLHVRDTFLASVARAAADPVASGVNEQHAKDVLMQTAQANPSQLRQVMEAFITPDVRAKLDKEYADNAKSSAEAQKSLAEAANVAGGGKKPEGQHVPFMLDGKPVQGAFVPSPTGGSYMFNGQDVTDRARPIPPAAIQVQGAAGAALQGLPSWALDDSRPTGADANKIDPSVRMTPNGLYQAALNYIANGQYPPTGRGNDPAAQSVRAAISSKVGAIAASSGMDEPALRAFYKSNGASLAKEQQMYDAVQGFMNTADKNAALLKESLKNIPDTGSPLFNKPLRDFSKGVAGNTELAKFATYLQSVQNEYGRIISQPNLAGQLTDSARKEAETLASSNATVPQLLAALDALQSEGSNRLVSVGDQIQRIQKRMSTMGAQGQAAPTTQTAPPSVIQHWEMKDGKLVKVGG